jgi:hypothetical protein
MHSVSRTDKIQALRLGTALLVTFVTMTSCGLIGSGNGPAPSPTPMSDAEVLAIGKQIAQCIRDQGIVEMPDPIVDENHHIQLPEGAEEQIEGRYPEATLQQAQQACQSLFDQLPESAVRDGGSGGGGDPGDRSPGPQDMEALRAFAQCVREQGIPEWPDPGADGRFPVSTGPLAGQAKSPRLIAAYEACTKYWNGQVSFS